MERRASERGVAPEQRSESGDRLDRRGFLECMAWAGTAVVWAVSGGLLTSCTINNPLAKHKASDLYFAQISDSHVGFKGPANQDVLDTFRKAIDQVNALPQRPAFVVHTGDLTHLAKPEQFDTVKQLLATLKTDRVFQTPGEHDTFQDAGRLYLEMFGKETQGIGYFSFDLNGVHFLTLNNVVNIKDLGRLGPEQIDFVKKDLEGLASDTPLVVFSHMPLFAMYPKWGWGTEDSLQALSLMKRFAAVTCLNGHVHQAMSKTEGNITFHTALATAYPQPEPGKAAQPGPLVLPAGQLLPALGVREVKYVAARTGLAIKEDRLG